MFINPFSHAKRLEMPDGKGLYLKPHTQTQPGGWGEPRKTPEGTPIKPGTPGGPFPNVLLTKDGKVVSNVYQQVAANITWWGPYVDPGFPSKGRYVLSFHGPVTRYFRQASFVYGATEKHNDIYYRGAYAAVAPAPVLGACLRKYDYIDDQGNATEMWWIVAVVKETGVERVYRKPFFGVTMAHHMTDTLREHSMRKQTADNPKGWRLMGSWSRPANSFGAETPWFFNESGTEACTMGRTAFEFNNGGSDVVEDRFERYSLSVGEGTASFNNEGGSSPMQYEESSLKERLPDYVSQDSSGWSHQWIEHKVKVEVTLEGRQVVLCDYIGDTLWVGELEYTAMVSQTEYFTWGNDPDPYYGDVEPFSETNITNVNNTTGQLPFPPDYVPAQGDHYHTVWSNYYMTAQLHLGPPGVEETSLLLLFGDQGTTDTWAGHPWQDDNPFLYYTRRVYRTLYGLDIRKLWMAYYEEIAVRLRRLPSAVVDTTNTKLQKVYVDYSGQFETYKADVDGGVSTSFSSFQVALVREWEDFSESYSRTTYAGGWTQENAVGDVIQPGNRVFYRGGSHFERTDWPSIPDLLYGAHAGRVSGSFVVTEHGNWAFSYEAPDVRDPDNAGASVVISGADQGTLQQLIGFGDRFHPVGGA